MFAVPSFVPNWETRAQMSSDKLSEEDVLRPVVNVWRICAVADLRSEKLSAEAKQRYEKQNSIKAS